jgi:hypothetical protein
MLVQESSLHYDKTLGEILSAAGTLVRKVVDEKFLRIEKKFTQGLRKRISRVFNKIGKKIVLLESPREWRMDGEKKKENALLTDQKYPLWASFQNRKS